MADGEPARTEVLVVGGGPVGLALAGDLGWRGRHCVLVEQTDGTIVQPKMDGVNVRTMEFCRRWGLVDTIKSCPYPSSFPQDMVYLTGLNGYELGREVFAKPSGGAEEASSTPSPESRVRCPQNMFDPILRDFAARWPTVDLRYETRMTGLVAEDGHVLVKLEDARTGRASSIRARYVVGCDGAGSSVREQVGISMSGKGVLSYTTNVVFRCADLVARHDKQLAYRHIFIGPEGAWATLVAINGRDEWRLSLIGGVERRKFTADDIDAAIRRLVGADIEYEIVSVVPWTRRELVADSFRSGNVFLAGDSAHVMSPTGGFGMNTGIADAVDLSWKLDAVLSGWGGPALLDSYESERRPVALRAAREATGNLARTLSPGANPRLLERSYEGALIRYEVGRRYSATMLREWYKLGIDLGYAYAGSPICWPEADGPAPSAPPQAGAATPPYGFMADGRPVTPSMLREWQRLAVHLAEGVSVETDWQELPAQEVMLYTPAARPGARAPHLWLEDGRSTLDLFGPSFILLRVGENAPASAPLEEAAREQGLPIGVSVLPGAEAKRLFARALVLVRPDGHVAWRGDAWPRQGAGALVERVRGAAEVPARVPETAA